jgi:plasmid stabilization system protein ParE
MKARISRRASLDLESICNRIALDNPNAADRLDQSIHDAIKLLAEFPGVAIPATI